MVASLTLTTMRAFNLLLLSLPFVAALPSDGGHDEQVLLSSIGDVFNDPKQAILDSKHNMQKWIHDGKEFIKQNNLLCAYTHLYMAARRS